MTPFKTRIVAINRNNLRRLLNCFLEKKSFEARDIILPLGSLSSLINHEEGMFIGVALRSDGKKTNLFSKDDTYRNRRSNGARTNPSQTMMSLGPRHYLYIRVQVDVLCALYTQCSK